MKALMLAALTLLTAAVAPVTAASSSSVVSDLVSLRREAAQARFRIALGEMALTNSHHLGVIALADHLIQNGHEELVQIALLSDGKIDATNRTLTAAQRAIIRQLDRQSDAKFDGSWVRAVITANVNAFIFEQQVALRARRAEVRLEAIQELQPLINLMVEAHLLNEVFRN